MKSQNTHQASKQDAPPTQFSALDSQTVGNSAFPPSLQLKSSSEQGSQSDSTGPIQRTLVGTHGWMNSVDLGALAEKLGGTLMELWTDLKNKGVEIFMEVGSPPSFDFSQMTLTMPGEWYASIKKFVDSGEQDEFLGRALSALTHEMSHAHDRLYPKDYPKGKDKGTDPYLITILRTELKAWMKEAVSAIENKRAPAKVERGEDNNELINGWLAVWFMMEQGKTIEDMLAMSDSQNSVLGRLKLYCNKNKQTDTSKLDILKNSEAGSSILDQLKAYAYHIRSIMTAPDETIEKVTAPYRI